MLVQTVHLSCTDTNTTSKLIETRFDMTHITYEFHQVCPKWTETSFHLSLIIYEFYQLKDRFSYLASKMIIEPMIRLVQTMHLS
jgi:hypothetical protein